MGKPNNTKQSLLNRIIVSSSGCWEWQGGLDKYGYGQSRYDGKNHKTHRLFYNLFVAPIPPKHMILHTCDNRICVNPNHLIIGTQQDNMNDMKSKGRARNQWTGPLQ